MIKHSTAALAAMTAAFGIAAAQDMGGVKLGVHLGGNFIISDTTEVVTPGEPTVDRDFDFDGGVAIGATASVAVAESLAIEAEYTFRNNEFAEGPADDDFNTSAFMVNALIPMEVDTSTTGYIGAGVGYLMKHDSDRSVALIDDLDGTFAWQIKGGFDYALEGGRTLGFGLTYLTAEFEDDAAPSESTYEIGSLMGTISLKFGG